MFVHFIPFLKTPIHSKIGNVSNSGVWLSKRSLRVAGNEVMRGCNLRKQIKRNGLSERVLWSKETLFERTLFERTLFENIVLIRKSNFDKKTMEVESQVLILVWWIGLNKVFLSFRTKFNLKVSNIRFSNKESENNLAKRNALFLISNKYVTQQKQKQKNMRTETFPIRLY